MGRKLKMKKIEREELSQLEKPVKHRVNLFKLLDGDDHVSKVVGNSDGQTIRFTV